MIEPALARRIRLVGIDVDGTLTDGGLYIGAHAGEKIELKRFDIQDGMGIKLLQAAGLKVALVTGRGGEAARLRAEELRVDEFVVSGGHKLPALETVLEKHGVAWDETCFVGDDLIDIPVMKRAALPVAVANAVAEVKACARFTTAAPGGHGAVRELTEALLRARGCWDTTVGTYLRERGDDAAG
jgi:3-deoxy-D-manno-octulosonate 8-phosphate phosphatase (KDO 8-P phosphatase)